MLKKRHVMSYVVVKTKLRSNTPEGGQQPCLKPRVTENSALVQVVLQDTRREIKQTHQRLLYLERVGMQPQNYPHEKRRPKRGLYGLALYRWIGGQVGMDAGEVRMWLTDADDIYGIELRFTY